MIKTLFVGVAAKAFKTLSVAFFTPKRKGNEQKTLMSFAKKKFLVTCHSKYMDMGSTNI